LVDVFVVYKFEGYYYVSVSFVNVFVTYNNYRSSYQSVGLLQVSYDATKTSFAAASPEERLGIVIGDLIKRRRKGFLISYVG
jgi:hypothetical protein